MTPALTFPPEVLLRAQGGALGMRAAIVDVDGVMTDGRLFIGEAGWRLGRPPRSWPGPRR